MAYFTRRKLEPVVFINAIELFSPLLKTSALSGTDVPCANTTRSITLTSFPNVQLFDKLDHYFLVQDLAECSWNVLAVN